MIYLVDGINKVASKRKKHLREQPAEIKQEIKCDSQTLTTDLTP